MTKLIEVDRASSPATTAWSPIAQYPGYLAAGTVAGTMSSTFDTSAHLEIFSFDFASKDYKVVGKVDVPERFHKIVWGQTGVQNDQYSHGLIVGGLANGEVHIWDASKIISNAEDSLITKSTKHPSGSPVQALDFNPSQHNFLASGGADSEIFVYDLQNASSPTVFSLGSKNSQDSVTTVSWNRKVAHILASATYSGTTSIWDVKQKRPLLNFTDQNKRMRIRSLAWNPEEGTQLVTTSDDDNTPVIALWDLRNTYAPVKYLEGHSGGVWSVSWCPMDNDLLLSTGKDNKTLCWNIKTGSVLSVVDPGSASWNFDVSWSPRVPSLLSTSSLEGKIKVLSLQDVREESIVPRSSENITQHAPKWLKRPAGATFGFGGKVYSFKKAKANEPQKFRIVQSVTDKDILERADNLDKSLSSDSLKAFCDAKIAESTDEEEIKTWNLLRVMFDGNQRKHILNYLGYDTEKVTSELEKLLPKKRRT
eukprot:TRINITY_DN3055_c0_g1_i1.p1 TRINITY_DN3055_c0_g1~~TRINITY_DN3055_c0_g1_i1.p1  ORF type:complete len:479 (-),score=131.65 TRINITY_DN3055_c0_g1_i1:316-1752(-)